MRAAMINRKDLSPIYNIRVERRGKDSVNIQWDTERPDLKVAVYLSDAPDVFGQEQPVAKAEGESIVTISGLNPDVRYYFKHEKLTEIQESIKELEKHDILVNNTIKAHI